MRWIFVAAIVPVLLLTAYGSSRAAGFALFEHSVSGMGTAFSAPAATADDASSVFFNPAGMTRLKGQQAQAALYVIAPRIDFDGEGSNLFGDSLGSDDGGDAGVVKAVPNAYYTVNTGAGWAFGIGVNVPFGLATSYDRGWAGRYHAVESDVLTVNVNPSLAYRVDEHLSIGAGVSAQYIDALLSQMIDFGLLALGPAGSQTADVFSELNADDLSYGYNLGLLWEFTPATRTGLAYRSRIRHELQGDATFDFSAVPAPLLSAAQAQFPSQGIRGDIDLPANAELSFFHRFNQRWAILTDLQWTEWSSFDKLVVRFDGSLAATPSVTTENWRDSWRYALGGIYNPAPQWSLRAGVSYDETPIPDAEHRTPRLPGEDRIWLALGAGYAVGAWSFDLAYVHVFVDQARIKKTASGEDESRGNLVGDFDFAADELAVAITRIF